MTGADLIFRGGTLLTQEPAEPAAEALAVQHGRIVAVGREPDVVPLVGPATRIVDLGGRTLIPGFIDAHAHIWKIGHLFTTLVDLRRAESLAALGTRLRAAEARLPPGGWLLGRGYNEARLEEGRSPTRWDLDRLIPDRPVVLTRTCGHIYAANSAALRAAGITRDTPDPAGGVVARGLDGEPTGLLHETAMGLINAHLPEPSRDELVAMIEAGIRHQLSLGVTSTNDAGVAPTVLDAYTWMDGERRLSARVNVMPLRRLDGGGTVPLPPRRESPFLRVDTVKFLADGGLSGGTAALSVPYRHARHQGVLRFADEDLYQLASESRDAGWRLAIHAIGDVTIDQVLRLYERLGPSDRRPRIEHLGLPDAEQLARAARLGAIAVPQPIFLHALGGNFRAFLPDHLLARAYPIRSMLDAGLTVALSSDAPVVENDDPLRGIRSAVDRKDDRGEAIAPAEAITVAEALYGYTMGGAIASGDAANRGSLAVGKWADLAVLSGDPLSTPVEAINELTVDQTWVAGRLAYDR